MKTIIFILFITLSIPTFGTTTEERPTTIELYGKYETHKNKSTVFPLEAFVTDNQIIVTFFNATTEVTISIIGFSSTIESRTLSFNDFQSEIFDISEYASGTYNLLITTPQGTFLYGNFVINN